MKSSGSVFVLTDNLRGPGGNTRFKETDIYLCCTGLELGKHTYQETKYF